MKSATLVGRTAPAIGFGCMGLSEFYELSADADVQRCLHEAYDVGYRHFDTADMYGQGRNEELLGVFLRELGQRRENVLIASKVGIVRDAGQKYRVSLNGHPDYIKESCERTLKRLRIDVLDLYYLHRRDPNVPLAESVGAIARLIEAGKVRGLGLSEVDEQQLREAHSVHPVAALQSELSLLSRDAEGVAACCRELGAAFVAFSPLGRGFLTGALSRERLAKLDPQHDLRTLLPRFQAAHLDTNFKLLDAFFALCRLGERAPAAVALGWVLARGEHVHALAGSSSLAHLRSNFDAGNQVLPGDLLDALDAVFRPGSVSGSRFPAPMAAATTVSAEA